MALFSKRKTVIQNIAYMGIMAAINVIFVLLTALLPPLMFLIIFVLPLTSAIVTLFCQKRYFPIYFIATIGLCLLVTSGIYIFDTFFYVLPSLITGFLFGILIELKVPSIFVITICNIIQYIITYLTFILLNVIVTNVNFIDVLLNMFGLGNFAFKDIFAHSFLFLLASIQTIFTYAFLKSEVKKLGFEFNLEMNYPPIAFAIIFTGVVGAFIFMFIYHPLVYVFLFAVTPLMVYLLIDLVTEKRVIIYVLLGASLTITTFFFAFFYNAIPHPMSVIFVGALYALISFIYFGNSLFINKTKSDKIDN